MASGQNAPLLNFVDGVPNFTFEHNTLVGEKRWLMFGPYSIKPKNTNMIVRNNLIFAATMHGDNMGQGTTTFAYYAPGIVFTGNALVGSHTASAYPANNFFVKTKDEVGFYDYSNDKYSLSSGSLFKYKATDGTDIGANISAIVSATAGVVK
jgi:hypothetical protein